MKFLGPLALAFLSATTVLATGSLVARAPPGGGYGYGGGTGDDTASGGSSSPQGGNSNTNGTSASARGDQRCNANMCIAAQVNGDTVRYTLTSQRDQVGYMAMGFGSRMVGSPMIIMWANNDGTVTLSQRQASRQAEPAVVSDPPRVATLQQAASVTSGNRHSYVFDLPANSDTTQNIIWAYSGTRPSSSAVDARLVQHSAQGITTLDLTRTSGGNGDDRDDSESIALTSGQRTFLAHAVISAIAFLIVMPIGGLIPRYLRTFTTGWFKFHWFIQFVLAGLLAVIGIVLGIVGISNAGGTHLNSPHKRVGIILLVLYFIQISLGAVIHFVKPKKGGRPPQNYVHAILGITIVALALYQVRTGYLVEWPELVGRPAPNAVNTVWIVWVVLLPVAYFGGLALLPKQWKQEKKSREASRTTYTA